MVALGAIRCRTPVSAGPFRPFPPTISFLCTSCTLLCSAYSLFYDCYDYHARPRLSKDDWSQKYFLVTGNKYIYIYIPYLFAIDFSIPWSYPQHWKFQYCRITRRQLTTVDSDWHPRRHGFHRSSTALSHVRLPPRPIHPRWRRCREAVFQDSAFMAGRAKTRCESEPH